MGQRLVSSWDTALAKPVKDQPTCILADILKSIIVKCRRFLLKLEFIEFGLGFMRRRCYDGFPLQLTGIMVEAVRIHGLHSIQEEGKRAVDEKIQ
jgi:hypothetical protein